MNKQNYSNHVQYYTPHHFVFYPVMLAGIACCTYSMFHYPDQKWEWLAIDCLFMLLSWLSFMMRQHYGLTNQNRTVRLEMRLRYFILTQQRLEPLENQLTFSRIAALRFASDEELPGLVQRAVKENLSAGEIKKAIKNWVADDMRV